MVYTYKLLDLICVSNSIGLSSYLLWDDVGRLHGIMALADDITDFLVAHDEVYAVGGQCQKRIIRMLQLEDEVILK